MYPTALYCTYTWRTSCIYCGNMSKVSFEQDFIYMTFLESTNAADGSYISKLFAAVTCSVSLCLSGSNAASGRSQTNNYALPYHTMENMNDLKKALEGSQAQGVCTERPGNSTQPNTLTEVRLQCSRSLFAFAAATLNAQPPPPKEPHSCL